MRGGKGIMAGAIFDGIGRAAAAYGSAQMASQQGAERERLAEERMRSNEMMNRERLENQRALNEARLAAAQAGGSGGGKGGNAPLELVPGGIVKLGAAARMDMSEPAFDAFLKAEQTGDWSAYERDTMVEGERPQGHGPGVPTMQRVLPNGFDGWRAAKRKVMAEIAAELTHRGDYKAVADGRETVRDMDVRTGIMTGNVKPEDASRAYLATGGKGLYDNMGEAGAIDKSTGKQTLNDLGKAKAADERASAGKHAADAGRAAAGAKDDSLNTIQQLRKSGEETLKDARKALTEFDKVNTNVDRPGREKLKAQRDQLAADVASARRSLQDVSSRLEERLAAKEGGNARPADQASPSPATPRPTQNGAKPSQADALAQAKAAIAAGKNRAAVIQRMKENGYSTEGL
jgi:hypothetical protein